MKNCATRLVLLPAIILNFIFLILSADVACAKEPGEFKKCVCNNQDKDKSLGCLDKLRESYFKDNKYAGFVDLLRKPCNCPDGVAPYLNYNIALSRYRQLRHLEESKGWDEYFARGNEYRDDIVEEAAKAVAGLPKESPELLYTRLLLYRFHKDQQDSFVDGALSDLKGAAIEYVKSGKDAAPVKEAADILASYDEKAGARELYGLYSRTLINSDIDDGRLKEIAFGFYEKANLDLSEKIYDAYIGRISNKLKKVELARELKEIARIFSYKDSAPCDMPYAENTFKRLEELGGMDVFDEELIYLRAFNLEKDREYARARDYYSLLSKKYPKGLHSDEATFKSGVISAYALRDLVQAADYFGRLVDNSPVTAYSLLSLYQLGLFKQWEGDAPAAKGYYNKLIEKAQESFEDIVIQAKERLKEVDNGAPLDHNTKTFMDAALKKEFSNLDMSKVDLKPDIYLPKSGQTVNISAQIFVAESGCLNVELNYLWSGDLGGASFNTKDTGIKASYNKPGTKLVGLVLISPSGITDYAFSLIDVQ